MFLDSLCIDAQDTNWEGTGSHRHNPAEMQAMLEAGQLTPDCIDKRTAGESVLRKSLCRSHGEILDGSELTQRAGSCGGKFVSRLALEPQIGVFMCDRTQ